MNRRALVIGGGIAGIQAALDIADGGYQVVLVESSPSIGGHMIQLSEVFPTLDCPQCIMTPKMVEISHHPNVTLLTYSQVEDVSGTAGDFRVRIRRKARYVDEDKCTGCGECVKGCPVQVSAEFDRGLIDRNAVYRPFAQAVPNVFTIDKRGHSPCRLACPAGVNMHAYVALISRGKYRQALDVIRETMPFAGVCGRVCTHPCEAACERGSVDAPVAIRALKRFVADVELQHGREKASPVERRWDEKVAIVGSGPAGLACAYDLVRQGYPVTVFEAMPQAGGLLRYGIPEYRLPRDVLDDEIRLVKELGAEIKTNARIAHVDGLLQQGYSAVFLAPGAGLGRRMDIPGEDSRGVVHALPFLEQVNRGEKVALGERVAVIGGGNAAVDAARVAVRLGAKDVSIVYRRTRREMPAIAEEVAEAEREGVRLLELTAPVEMLSEDGHVVGIRCIRMELGQPDESGRRRPVPITGSEFDMPIDGVILAIGQEVDRSALPDGIECTRWGTVAADPVTLQTSVPGIFAGGDALAGPADVISAIATGKEAAVSIHRYLRGLDLRMDRKQERTVAHGDASRAIQRPRAAIPMLETDRRGGFDEVELCLSEAAAVAEAQRCLNCAACSECMECVKLCEARAIDHTMKDELLEINVGAIVVATGYETMPRELVSEYASDPDVIDGLQFERILCPSGHTAGVPRRPSDGSVPKEVVFVSCVGSRDPEHGVPYCSRVCCMYLAKQALLYKHAVHDGQAYVFYMDTRTTGKGYEEFVERAVKEEGLLYLRGRVSRVYRDGDRLRVQGADTLTGKRVDISCDLVVLGMALIPNPGTIDLARRLGIEADRHGFIVEADPKLRPLETTVPGIYVCGTAQGPRDIPDSVAQASGAAGKVLALFAQRDRTPAGARR